MIKPLTPLSFSTTLTQFVVINEHTLGFHIPGSNSISILRASILRGSPFGDNPIAIPTRGMRFAVKEDGEDYRIDLGQYVDCPYHETPPLRDSLGESN